MHGSRILLDRGSKALLRTTRNESFRGKLMNLDDLDAWLGVKVPGDESPGNTERPLVLVVDDDSHVADGLELLLSQDYRVVVCSSAAKAIESLTDEVSAVILDIKMKGHDGFWACDQIRKRNAFLPVIFHSAYQDTKDPLEIINQHQPFGYIIKGATNELLKTMARAIGYYQIMLDNQKNLDELASLRSELRDLESTPTE
jgi:CheY-like chemotaxis protein